MQQQWIQSIKDQVSTQYYQAEGSQYAIILYHKNCETDDQKDHLLHILQSSGITVLEEMWSDGADVAKKIQELVPHIVNCSLLFVHIITSDHRVETVDFKETILDILPKDLPLVRDN